MDFSNRQVKKLLARIEELESDKNQLESDLIQALRAPFTKYEKKNTDAIYFHAQHLKLSTEEWRSGKKELLKRFRKLCENDPMSHHDTDNIRKRLITHNNELFVFLKYPTIPPTNNPAESAIRNSVLFRKITFGNQTAQGKLNVSLITTIIRTAKLKNLDPVGVLRQIMVGITPALFERFGVASSAIPQAP